MSTLTRRYPSPFVLARSAAFARSEGVDISAADFLESAAALSASLAPCGHVVNLCENSYRFLVGFAAAVLRGRTTLLPPSHAPSAVAEMIAAFPECCVLNDASVIGSSHSLSIGPVGSSMDFVAAIGHTSGSTGKPVAHAKSWSGLRVTTSLNAATIRASIGSDALGQQPWIVATVPPQHMYGLETSVLLPLLAGFGVHGGRPLLPADVASTLEETPVPRVLVSTPVHLRALTASRVTFPEVAVVVSATAPLPVDLARDVQRRLGAVLVEFFGSTETCVIATRKTASDDGWRPYPGVGVRHGGGGTIVSAPWFSHDQRLHDIVELRRDGTFVVVGRGNDVIEVAGKRASLTDLTRRLQSLDGVNDAVVFQPAGQEAGAVGRCAALVVAPSLTASEIARRMRNMVDAAFVPRPIVLVPKLPRNDVGKLPREQLLELLATSSASRPRRGT